jgi:cytochrome b involved in lipid metabolism
MSIIRCVDSIFKGYDYNNIPIKVKLFKMHNKKDNVWISIDNIVYSISKNDNELLNIFKNFYGSDVKNFILNDEIFKNIKKRILILEKLKKRKIGFLLD